MKENPRITRPGDILKIIGKRKTVKKSKIRWKLEDRFAIRAAVGRRWFCPITFCCYIKTGHFFFCENILDVYEAVEKYDITEVEMLLRASDGNILCNRDKIFRRKLLQATGLLEQARQNGEKI